MNMKVNPRIPTKKLPSKQKLNKKRLFFIFFSAFLVFFFLCTLAATLLTPKLDVPALKNDPNLDALTSEDFKERIDPRLKSIELQEETAPPSNEESPFSNKTTQDSAQNEIVIDAPSSESDEFKDDASFDNFDEVPFNSKNPKSGQAVNPAKPPQPKIVKPVSRPQPVPSTPAIKPYQETQPESPTSTPQNGLILRDKIKVQREPISTNKIIVGNYYSPTEAKRISQELMQSNLNVTPFIKENNGVYSLQVGSYSSQQKAENLVNELKKRNISARIIQD